MTASSMAHNVAKHPSAKEERKLRKPLIERKRRERINNCLDQLKETVIGAFRLDQSKLEKADILEMTVKHLQNIQSNKLIDPALGLEAQQKYSTGYIQCMHEVHNMLLTCEWMDKTLGSRLLNHLLKSLPRSTDEAPLQPPPRQDVPPLPSHGARLPCTPVRGDPQPGRQVQREAAPHHHAAGYQERPPLHSPHLGMLEMWRPW
ncbi:hairy-related 8.2 [Myripristis murdjan]|uniref:hairy-related 8.2 n=1 Tax=Myripristis murdjan TaxID=586833 RepID=UPI001175ECD9|nr:transcription cofactor HES-6-like [Myripristis murdjan]